MSGETRVALFFLFIVLLFSVALAAVGVWPFRLEAYVANLVLYLSAWVIFAAIHALVSLAGARPDRPLAYLRDIEFGAGYRARIRQSWPILAISILFMPAFSAMKSAIPLFNRYSWDQRFIDLDIALHGQDAWRLLQPVIGYPVITSTISLFYQLWILLIYAGTIYFALYVTDRRLRVRYFAACFSVWTVNGAVLAIFFASVGPCFLDPFLGNHHFADQMDYLHMANGSHPVMALEVQQRLIDWYADRSNGLGRGISAMPSMHVALAFLFFLAVRHVSRPLGIFFLAYAGIILVGSVHLAYHYAVDGYLAIAVTAVLWVLSGIWTEKFSSGWREASEPPALETQSRG